MLAELGQIALILALLVATVQGVLPLAGAQRQITPWMALARPAAYLQLALVALAYVLLTIGFVQADFSIRYVQANSNSLLPMVYRFTAVWGAHEGALLLWTLVLAGWSAAVALFSRQLPATVSARVLAVMGLISVGFLSFMLFTSNPFDRILPTAAEGQDLNPLLQDPGMIIHPPMLYMGYVGFSVPFAFAIAAMLEGQIDNCQLRWTRPWTNIAWGFLTLGIALGSWWAYYELGWGGWWFWDPVENASFMPWLVGAALIHSQAVTEKRGSFAGWTLLLAIAAFSLSLLGTFLVRSGVLTSVHAFAADPERGLYLLIFLAIVVGGSLLLYALKPLHPLSEKQIAKRWFAPYSRETLLLANNLLLCAACAMVLLGTLYPLLADALNLGKISVGPPYFGPLFLLLMAPLVLLVPLGPLTRWQREQPRAVLALLAPWFAATILLGGIAFFIAPQAPWKTALGIAAAAWVALGTWRFVLNRLRSTGKRFTLEMLGMLIGHGGIALFLMGALLVEGLTQQRELALSQGQSIQLHQYQFTLEDVQQQQGPNYVADTGTVSVHRNGQLLTTLHPQKRAYRSGGQVMTETGIHAGLLRDLYVALGEPLGNGAWALRVQVKPFVRWIWLGALLMMLGSFITAFDARFRKELRL